MSASIHHFSRTSGALAHLNTLDLRLEVRDVYCAQGIGRNNSADLPDLHMPGVLIPSVLAHGYTANLVASSVSVQGPDCDPDLKPHLGRLKAMTAAQMGIPLERIQVKDTEQTWWAYIGYYAQERVLYVVLHAGWNEMTTSPWGLGATEMNARVFIHFGCSTYKHNHKVIREFKGWKKEGDRGYCYLTSDLSYGHVAVFYLHHLLSCDQPSRGRAWEDSGQVRSQENEPGLGEFGMGVSTQMTRTYLLFCLGLRPLAAACDGSPDIASEAQPLREKEPTGPTAEERPSTPNDEVEAAADVPDQEKAPSSGSESADKQSDGQKQPPTVKNGESTANSAPQPSATPPSEPAGKKKPRYCAFPSDEGCIPRGSNVPLTVDM